MHHKLCVFTFKKSIPQTPSLFDETVYQILLYVEKEVVV